MLRIARSVAWMPVTIALSAAIFTAGCYVETGTAAEDGTAYDGEPPPPPPPQQEVVPAAPGPDYVWVGGYHRWDGHRYVWVGGRYNHRPHPNARWSPAHWEGRGRKHVFVEGHWD
jgi:WXXGXW repeat (2 copies)